MQKIKIINHQKCLSKIKILLKAKLKIKQKSKMQLIIKNFMVNNYLRIITNRIAIKENVTLK